MSRLRHRDPLAAGFLFTAGAVIAGSLLVAALTAAIAFKKIDASLAATVIGVATVAIGSFLAFEFYRLYAAAEKASDAEASSEGPGNLSTADIVRLPVIEISLSRLARRFIRKRGGAVYLWAKEFGGGFALIEASTASPGDVIFRRRSIEGIDVFVSDEVLVQRLKVRLLPLPRPRLFADSGSAAGGGPF